MQQMHNEKPNNPLAEKLDGMNSLPEGFGFSATRVWDQLENQLQEKKRQPMLWLRYAAAIVLLAGAAILWIMQRETAAPKEIFTKQSKEQAPINTPTTIPIEAAKKSTIPNKMQEPTTHRQDVLVTEKSLAASNIEPTSIAKLPTTIPVESSPFKDSAQNVATIATAISSPVIATKPTNKSATIRKRYPVVHLYDLYREPEPSYTKSAPKKQSNLETEETPVNTQESNKTWWLPKTKPVIITSLTDNQ